MKPLAIPFYPTHTGDIGAFLDSDRGWQAVTPRQDVECLVIHLGGVGKVHSLQDMGEEMIGDGGRALGNKSPRFYCCVFTAYNIHC